MSDTHSRSLALLRESLDDEDAQFHEHQWEAISSLVDRRERLLLVQRTGWGKSAVYFIATRLLREQGYGPTIIVSPLLALMRNQVESARSYGVRLGTINSSNTDEENNQAESDLLADRLDAIIISPERLANTEFLDKVLRPVSNSVGLLVVDEAHCISDWGHDFRPDYKRIVGILSFMPDNLPVVATTATANRRVTQDVASHIGTDATILRGALMRESLRLQTISFPRRSQRLAWLASTLPNLPGTGIVYVATIRDAELVASWLKNCGIRAEPYYGALRGLAEEENRVARPKREADLMANRLKALVATSALGMGYDKPDLAFVIHFQSPGSVVAYYQQVGRAGRRIPRAYGVLLSGSEDDKIQQYFIQNAFPREELIDQLLSVVDSAPEGLTVKEINKRVNARQIKAAIQFLLAESPAPLVRSDSKPKRLSRTLLEYELPVEMIRRVTEIKKHEWQSMRGYLAHGGCLMQYLARELDDGDTVPCGRCANCDPEGRLSPEYPREIGVAAAEFMENVLIDIPPKRKAGTSPAHVNERFPEYQFPVSFGELEHEPGRALSYWGEAGWGELAMTGKHDGQFDPGLLKASARLLRKRWQPSPEPRWVTFVPSQNNPRLVRDFAKGLADELGLPCREVVKKAHRNQPQKAMENAEHRCRNLDGAFAIEGEVSSEPVLLVDDVVDSGWTFAVVSALLRRERSGPVLPFAVTCTATRR